MNIYFLTIKAKDYELRTGQGTYKGCRLYAASLLIQVILFCDAAQLNFWKYVTILTC